MTVREVYGSMDNVQIITLAPEKAGAAEVIQELSNNGITVSVGHSMANLSDGENAVHHGARLITHLFNAMLPVEDKSFPHATRFRGRYFKKDIEHFPLMYGYSFIIAIPVWWGCLRRTTFHAMRSYTLASFPTASIRIRPRCASRTKRTRAG